MIRKNLTLIMLFGVLNINCTDTSEDLDAFCLESARAAQDMFSDNYISDNGTDEKEEKKEQRIQTREKTGLIKYRCGLLSYTYNIKNKTNSIKQKRITKPKKIIPEGEKPYKCKNCSFAAGQSANLRIHIARKHIRIPKHKCSECEYATYTKGELRKHYKNKHTDEFDLECEHCTYKTKIRFSLLRHVARQHLICKFKKKHKTKEQAFACKNTCQSNN